MPETALCQIPYAKLRIYIIQFFLVIDNTGICTDCTRHISTLFGFSAGTRASTDFWGSEKVHAIRINCECAELVSNIINISSFE